MPSITWHTQDGGAKTEDGKVAVLSKLLFVNGAKKRKLSDLGAIPELGTGGKVILHFGEDDWCDVKFEQKKEADEFARLALEAMGNHKAGEAPWERAIKVAMTRAQSQPFASPFPADFQGSSKPGQVPKLVVDMCAAWQASEATRERTHKEKIVTLEAQRNEEQRLRKLVEDDIRKADFKLREAEDTIASMQKTTEFLNKEVAAMKKLLANSDRADASKLQFLEEELAALRQRMKDGFQTPTKAERRLSSTPAPAPCDMAKAIAEYEASPLQSCLEQERPALKKRLLLKWHPDKQPSAAHADLSKRVMQELQNIAGWEASGVVQ